MVGDALGILVGAIVGIIVGNKVGPESRWRHIKIMRIRHLIIQLLTLLLFTILLPNYISCSFCLLKCGKTEF